MSNPSRPRRKAPVEHDPKALREARIRAGWRQGDLAREVGVVQSVISEAETGTRGVSVVVRARIADVLHCDPITFAPLEVNA
jgi:transcriptional regulator with XRE-family HTH domain